MVFPGHGIAWKDFFAAFRKEWKEDKLTDIAGSLVFFGVLALFPFLLFLVTLAGYVMKPDQVEAVIGQLAVFAPKDVTSILATQIRDIHKGQNVGLITLGFLGAIWSASGGVSSLMESLNGIYAVKEGRPFWKVRLLAIAATLGAGLAILVAVLAGVVAGPVADHLPAPFSTAVTLLRLPIAGLIMMLVWASLYYFLPDVEQKFKWITPGSVMGVLIWVAASWAFSLYVSHFGSYNKTYGAIGGVVVLLMWMWISTIVLLLGAEMNAIIEHLSPDGKRTGAKSMADTGADAPKTEKKEEKEAVNPPFVPVPSVHITHLPGTPPRQRAALKPTLLGLGLLLLTRGRRRHS